MNNKYALKWIIQRLTALFLIPLTFWFIYNCIEFQYLEYQELRRFFQSYLNSFLFLLMMFFMILHAKLGCETIISDYIKTPYLFKIFKNVINFFTIFSLLLVIVAITKISIT